MGTAPEANFCVPFRRFSAPGVLLRPAGIDRRCQVISGFRRHLGLTDTLGLDLMLNEMSLNHLKLRYCEFQKSVEGGQPKKIKIKNKSKN